MVPLGCVDEYGMKFAIENILHKQISLNMSSKVISGIIIALLLLLSGYLWYNNSNLQKQNNAQTTELAELGQIQKELDADYQAALESIEGLRTDNQELNLLIDNQKEELKAQKSKINNLIWTKRELDKAREEIGKFETLTAQYLADITDLKSQNEYLTAENNKLTENIVVLNEDLATEKALTSELTETKAVLMSDKEDLETKNASLAEKVEVGSAIKINWMSLEGGEVKDDGSWKRRKIAKRSKTLRTCFRTETNVVVPAGEETFFLRIIGPTGETYSSEELGSGELTDKQSGDLVRYTMSGTLTYNNEDTEACMDWDPNFEVSKGQYKVEIYNKGYKVGLGEFKL